MCRTKCVHSPASQTSIWETENVALYQYDDVGEIVVTLCYFEVAIHAEFKRK